MPKLIDDTPSFAMGLPGFLQMIDEMNGKRAQAGIRQRYKPVETMAGMTMEIEDLPHSMDRHAPSPTYSRPRLVSDGAA